MMLVGITQCITNRVAIIETRCSLPYGKNHLKILMKKFLTHTPNLKSDLSNTFLRRYSSFSATYFSIAFNISTPIVMKQSRFTLDF